MSRGSSRDTGIRSAGARTPLLHSFLESDAQKMENQDYQPSSHPTNGAHQNAQPVDRYVVVEHQVRQEEKNHPQNGVADEPHQTEAPPHEDQDPKHHQDEDDQLRIAHDTILY